MTTRYPIVPVGGAFVVSMHRTGIVRWRDASRPGGTWVCGVRNRWASILLFEVNRKAKERKR